MVPSTDELIARFRAEPDTPFSTEQIAALRTRPDDIWALKAVALHSWRTGDLKTGLEAALRIAHLEPTDESVINAGVMMRQMGLMDEAAKFLASHRAIVDPTRFADLMCSLMAYRGDVEQAVHFGNEALRLKDAGVPAAISTFRSAKPDGRRVVSFSVWGSGDRYLQGALNNAVVGRYLYPGWTLRFYTDLSTPEPFRQALAGLGAEVVMPDLPADPYGLFWRFLVEDDVSVSLYVVRDADSVCNIKERVAVAEWIESGRAFHVIRDDLQHSELVLAGLWGAVRGNIGTMRERVVNYVSALPKRANYVHKDQHFLRHVIWPIMKGSLCTHDRYFDFQHPRRFDPRFDLPPRMHVGQNDWVNRSRSS